MTKTHSLPTQFPSFPQLSIGGSGQWCTWCPSPSDWPVVTRCPGRRHWPIVTRVTSPGGQPLDNAELPLVSSHHRGGQSANSSPPSHTQGLYSVLTIALTSHTMYNTYFQIIISESEIQRTKSFANRLNISVHMSRCYTFYTIPLSLPSITRCYLERV